MNELEDDLTRQLDRVDLIADSPELWGGQTVPESVKEATKSLLSTLDEFSVGPPRIYPNLDEPGLHLEWVDPGNSFLEADLTGDGVALSLVVTAAGDPGDGDVHDEPYPLWAVEQVAARIQALLSRG